MVETSGVFKGPTVVYKLTDQAMRTYKGFQWTLNEEKAASGKGMLCTNGWLHCYEDPDIAIILNPIHAAITGPRLFKGLAHGAYCSDGLKLGVQRLTLTKELAVPIFSQLELVAWSIFIVREIPGRTEIPVWETWADSILATKHLAAYATYDAYAAEAASSVADAAYDAAVARAAAAAHAVAAAAAHAADDAVYAGIYAMCAARVVADAADYFSLMNAHSKFLSWRGSNGR